ncbi:MBL fold metallo-hydrolase [Candidatus Neptunochlamydia vexilliferae]|uniref:Rhodanese domain-containing protein n=1 Tax=Candidatus Neptunichlamydia vexilliferae TaxID=1651774 RepID=A0ABS0AZ61_9BACT|nr:MBL fold metallo-hydrolase [Candidatus Neptunochlamydia vexilliferae]MBF5059404.1 hypothetical protein [Candidatus Neptunochlamydia vexilliferae]
MLIERFEEKGLSHYSYAVGDAEKGQIAIIDPQFDVDVYLDYAEKHRLVISHVFETHIHADYISGARYLAARTKATLVLSGYDKGEKFEVGFPHKECFNKDTFHLGNVNLEALHTPGHTPEHLSFLAWVAGEPKALFSGDFLFVGSVGRADVLDDKETTFLAKKLYQSVKTTLKGLPNHLPILPGHGAGSLCGGGMLSQPSSTLGQERLTNPFLKPKLTEKEFIDLLFARTPCRPDYFSQVKAYNCLEEKKEMPTAIPLDPQTFKKEVDKGAFVLDLHDQKNFSRGHIPGAVCIGAGAKLGFWAATTIPYDIPILLVAPDPLRIDEAVRSLARVGFSKITGYLKGGNQHWKEEGFPLEAVGEIFPDQLDHQKEVHLIDVRTPREWENGHLEGALHIPCSELPKRLGELPQGKLLFICAGGYRSVLAASLAKKEGRQGVSHLPGGMLSLRARKEINTTI